MERRGEEENAEGEGTRGGKVEKKFYVLLYSSFVSTSLKSRRGRDKKKSRVGSLADKEDENDEEEEENDDDYKVDKVFSSRQPRTCGHIKHKK
ncbi:hypothetical protein E2C01_093554 [Portunus trituberculatus]|uniref:Uncharacterized protein n=1 Tax=Portunus trituberculatus TaxID=210409 RepID=A0A5B7JZ12_PORTR|nr:hypothetical protein [Portunus trituberculatus]